MLLVAAFLVYWSALQQNKCQSKLSLAS